MKRVKVEGRNHKHKVLMYTLSTCAWCKMTKQFLKDNKVEYEYVDVDLCSEEDKDKIHEDIEKRGGEFVYPTLIIDDKTMITGFRKDRIKEALDL
jgi:glutaredoxin